MSDTTTITAAEVIAILCKCEAKPGEMCKTRNGREARDFHVYRVTAAEQAKAKSEIDSAAHDTDDDRFGPQDSDWTEDALATIDAVASLSLTDEQAADLDVITADLNEAQRLHQTWSIVHAEVNDPIRTPGPLADQTERATYSALVEFLDSHGLKGSDFDPRGTTSEANNILVMNGFEAMDFLGLTSTESAEQSPADLYASTCAQYGLSPLGAVAVEKLSRDHVIVAEDGTPMGIKRVNVFKRGVHVIGYSGKPLRFERGDTINLVAIKRSALANAN